MVGAELNHYKVIAQLGKGGMGEVYLAEDTRLRRKIALKVLPTEMAEDPDRLARFRREAIAIAALNHPNIVTIHSVEESNGVHFLTMELVVGKPLSELIGKDGMSLSKLLEIATAMAGALSAAHTKGITHRDLKPPNVMVADDGGIKVLDFGLAKFAPSSTAVGLDSELSTEVRTREGMIVGTVPYMSPEQIQGGAVDPRSDIFSLGVMLYEMASGRRPFTGDSAIALLSSILKDDPAPLDGLPERLNAILERCLAKDPAARFQNGEEFLAAISAARAPEVTVAGSDTPWIVVRPFKTRSGDDELSSFSEGLTEDITAGLSRFTHLSVLTDRSASHPSESYAVEGSIRKAASSIRVSVKLLDKKSGAHLWADHFDRDMSTGDIFAARDEIADRIVATVADTYGVLTRSLVALVKAKPIEALSASECVLRWFGFVQIVRPDEHAEVREALENALEREPEHADAWACLSLLYVEEYRHNYNPRPDPLERTLKAARRSVELDATSPLAHLALATAHWHRRELSAFRPAGERVLTLNPRDSNSIAFIGVFTSYSGDWARGKALMARAMALNPHHGGWFHFPFVWDHYLKGKYNEALEAAEKVNLPMYYQTHIALAVTNAQLERTEAARKHVENLLELVPDYAGTARSDLSKWYGEELVEHLLEGLAKAGLDVGVAVGAHDVERRPFVGREAEQDQLVTALHSVAKGNGRLVLIGGEPGVGKTRLAHELMATARARGMRAFTGNSYEEGAAPFIPIIEILEQMMRDVSAETLRDALGDGAPEVAKLVPELRRAYTNIPEPIELPPEQQRRALFNATLDLFQALSAKTPIVMLLDDLHWADESSLALLQHVTQQLENLPLLIIGTYRDVALDVGKPFEKAMATLVRQKLAERLPLKRLPEGAVAELLAALGGAEPPEALVHLIFEGTEGNPFFVSEVFLHLKEEGKLLDDGGAFRVDLNADDLDVPEGVRLVIGRRLKRLSENTPKVLTAAAVVGRRFELRLVEALSDLDEDAFLTRLKKRKPRSSSSLKQADATRATPSPTSSFVTR